MTIAKELPASVQGRFRIARMAVGIEVHDASEKTRKVRFFRYKQRSHINVPWEEVATGAVSFRRTRYWLSAGVQEIARSSEVSSETVMVMANARKKVPVTPVMEISGRNTTIGVIVEPISGMVNSRSAL